MVLMQSLIFATFLSVSFGQVTEFYCCSGWSDDEENMIVFMHEKTGPSEMCTAVQRCAGESSCSILYSGTSLDLEHPEPGTTTTRSATGPPATPSAENGEDREESNPQNCWTWKPSAPNDTLNQCKCHINYCNCPQRLRDTKPKAPPVNLECCQTQGKEVSASLACTENPSPQACTGFYSGEKKQMIYGCGIGDRPFDKCANFTGIGVRNQTALDGTCRCYRDFCNCPDSVPIPGGPKPNETTTTTRPASKGQQQHQIVKCKIVQQKSVSFWDFLCP